MEFQFKRISYIGERLVAAIIDDFLFTIIMVLAIMGFALINQHGEIVVLIVFLVIMILFLLKDLIKGRSIGKLIMGIAVRSFEDPTRIPEKWRLIIRNLFLLMWPVDLFVMFFNHQGQRLGDKIAGTIVIKVTKNMTEEECTEQLEKYSNEYSRLRPFNKSSAIKTILISIVVIGTLLCLFVFGISSLMKSSGAYQTAISQIETDETIHKRIGKVYGYGLLPTGSITTSSNGTGDAEFVIKVKGEKATIKVFTSLKKVSGEWEIQDMEIVY